MIYLRFQTNQVTATNGSNAIDPQNGEDFPGVGVGIAVAAGVLTWVKVANICGAIAAVGAGAAGVVGVA